MPFDALPSQTADQTLCNIPEALIYNIPATIYCWHKPTKKDVMVLRKTIRSLKRPNSWTKGTFENSFNPEERCVIGWMMHHSGEPLYYLRHIKFFLEWNVPQFVNGIENYNDDKNTTKAELIQALETGLEVILQVIAQIKDA